MRITPVNVYENGRYTVTWSSRPKRVIVCDVTKPKAFSTPSADVCTTTGRSKRRFSPTNAASRSLVEEYTNRTSGSRLNALSTNITNHRARTVEARNPNRVISATL